MIDLHLSAFAPRWRFLYAVRIDAYEMKAELAELKRRKAEGALPPQIPEGKRGRKKAEKSK